MTREERARATLATVLPNYGFSESDKQGIALAMLAFANSELERAIQLTKVQSGAYAARHTVALIRAMMEEWR